MRIGNPVTIEMVKAHQAWRIEQRFPLHVQLNILRAADPDAIAAMDAFILNLKQRAALLEGETPIPADYRDDKHWA